MELTVGAAKALARSWVLAEAEANPAIVGAFFHGSITTQAEEALVSPSSDIDVMVVLADGAEWSKPGKFRYGHALLEVSSLSSQHVSSPEVVLGQYALAGSFRFPGVILDRGGRLTGIQRVVGREFARREWVRRRCENARDRVIGGFPLREADPLPDAANGWLFPAGVTTHILLVAGLRNPTVRKRYQTTKELLDDYGQLAIYGLLLDLLGARHITAAQATGHLAALTRAFDTASAVVRSPFVFAADISDVGRPIAIGGTAEMIATGFHREAMFWLTATFIRCLQVLRSDAPPDLDLAPVERDFRALLADLGIGGFADLERRRTATLATLPAIWSVAEAIMAANPAITD
jgi:hypothetical protein